MWMQKNTSFLFFFGGGAGGCGNDKNRSIQSRIKKNVLLTIRLLFCQSNKKRSALNRLTPCFYWYLGRELNSYTLAGEGF